MASKHQLTGMLGVYLVAAELTRHDFIVSTTSRSAAGADLLVTNLDCSQTWSIQVKTNRNPANFWLMSANSARHAHRSHIYVFVNIRGEGRPSFLVVPSLEVKDNTAIETSSKGSVWYSFPQVTVELHAGSTDWVTEGWDAVFGKSTAPSTQSNGSEELYMVVDGHDTDEYLHQEMLDNPEANALSDEMAVRQSREIGLAEDFIARNLEAR